MPTQPKWLIGKVDCFLMKKVFALQCQKAEPSGWPWKWTCNLWWWRGLFWECLIPLRGGKVEARKQGNKYFPMERAWCREPTSDRGDHISSSWEGIVDCLLWTCLLLMPQGAGRSQNVFSWEWEDKGLLFFCFSKAKKKRLKGIHPNKNWKQLK